MEIQVKALMAKLFRIPEDSINEETSMEAVNGWDSLRHIELITQLEDKFGLTFEMEEIIEMTNFSKIIEMLGRKGEN